MIQEMLLEWFGNVLNFIVLIYLIISVVGTGCFDIIQSIIASISLLVSVLIHLFTSLNRLK